MYSAPEARAESECRATRDETSGRPFWSSGGGQRASWRLWRRKSNFMELASTSWGRSPSRTGPKIRILGECS